jgi:hypothetical protein
MHELGIKGNTIKTLDRQCLKRAIGIDRLEIWGKGFRGFLVCARGHVFPTNIVGGIRCFVFVWVHVHNIFDLTSGATRDQTARPRKTNVHAPPSPIRKFTIGQAENLKTWKFKAQNERFFFIILFFLCSIIAGPPFTPTLTYLDNLNLNQKRLM